jgi:hypothetical protein
MYDGGNITVWAKAITPYGCVDSVKAVIGEAAPDITANNPLVICPGESANLTATVSGCTTTAMTYTWDIGGNVKTTTEPATPSGVLNATTTYTVTVRNAYGKISAVSNTGTITVHPATTIQLSSGSNNQSIYNNNAITQIKYTTENATGVTPSNLPPGVTGLWSAGVYTLRGTPTTNGTYNYTITTTNSTGCSTPQATGKIFVCRSKAAASWTTCSGFTQITNEQYEMCAPVAFIAAPPFCASKGTGWRMPTQTELKCMYEHRGTLPGGYIVSTYLWGEYTTGTGRYIDFSDGTGNITGAGSLRYVKCVK